MSSLLSLRTPVRRVVRFFQTQPRPAGAHPAGPSIAHAEGLIGAGQELGLRLQLAQTGTPVRLGAVREEAAFRAIRDGLAAAAAHGDATAPVTLELHWSRQGLTLRLTGRGPEGRSITAHFPAPLLSAPWLQRRGPFWPR